MQPGDHLLVWCHKDAPQGPLHAPFKLPKKGGRLLLATRDAIVETVTYGPMETDQSWAHLPDGTGYWTACDSPSPRAANSCGNVLLPTATASPEPDPTITPPAPTVTSPPAEPTVTATPPRVTVYLPWAVK